MNILNKTCEMTTIAGRPLVFEFNIQRPQRYKQIGEEPMKRFIYEWVAERKEKKELHRRYSERLGLITGYSYRVVQQSVKIIPIGPG